MGMFFVKTVAGGRFVEWSLIAIALILFASPANCSSHEIGVSTAPTTVFSLGKFPVTDSVILSWIVSLFIVLVIRLLLRGGVRVIPSVGQGTLEVVIDGLRAIIEPIVGSKAFKTVFPCLLSYFIFILLQNMGGLLPGIGSIGVYVGSEFKPFLRPATSDLNTTLALAIVAFFAWVYFCVRCAGIRGLFFEIFGNKADKSEIALFVYGALFLVFWAVGLIECISILCRIISLSFRLFGNAFGGETLLHNMYGFTTISTSAPIVRYLAYLIPLPFYFLEFLVAIIQSFVFTLLVSVYIGLVCGQGEHGVENLKKEKYVASDS
jgi:F-type H+-transporting ATPase subunit a